MPFDLDQVEQKESRHREYSLARVRGYRIYVVPAENIEDAETQAKSWIEGGRRWDDDDLAVVRHYDYGPYPERPGHYRFVVYYDSLASAVRRRRSPSSGTYQVEITYGNVLERLNRELIGDKRVIEGIVPLPPGANPEDAGTLDEWVVVDGTNQVPVRSALIKLHSWMSNPGTLSNYYTAQGMYNSSTFLGVPAKKLLCAGVKLVYRHDDEVWEGVALFLYSANDWDVQCTSQRMRNATIYMPTSVIDEQGQLRVISDDWSSRGVTVPVGPPETRNVTYGGINFNTVFGTWI